VVRGPRWAIWCRRTTIEPRPRIQVLDSGSGTYPQCSLIPETTLLAVHVFTAWLIVILESGIGVPAPGFRKLGSGNWNRGDGGLLELALGPRTSDLGSGTWDLGRGCENIFVFYL